jgi:conjugative transfer region protein TrbK
MTMDIRTLTRGIASVALAAALLAAPIALNDRPPPASEASSSPSAFDRELARCRAIATQATDDAICKAIWEAGRERFFGSKKLYRDRVTDPVSATSGLKQPALPLRPDVPRNASQPPSAQTFNAPDDTREQ